MISLSAKNEYEHEMQTTFVPKQISFTITPPNTNISIQRSFTMLESIPEQDLFKWKEELIQTISLASWDEETSIGVIKASIASKYLHLIQNKRNLQDIWDAIFKYKYPRGDYLRYLNQLSNTHQNSFLTIKEYHSEIERLTLRLGICLDWSEDIRKMKVQESFINGLSKRTQLEMARLNIRECAEIYSVIDSTEETMIEQMKANRDKNTHQRTEDYKTKKFKQKHKRHNDRYDQKFCKFHNVNTHDTAECRAMKQKASKDTQKHQKDNNTHTLAIKELTPRITALETTGSINDKSINLIIDTGSAYSYIDSKIVKELGLRQEEVQERLSVTVDGSKIITNQESSFMIQLQGDKCNHYKVKARILDRITTDLILGVDFMKTTKRLLTLTSLPSN
ncbi:hypothetical protein DMUE_2521 [Dictyocoela muelleri]|nr:hypothetical protein DMUE_2521 [Dictyocoela muelleri]